MRFGFLPRRLDVAAGDFTIATIADWRAHRAEIEALGHVRNGWLYKPRKDGSPECVGRYQLPVTHEIQSTTYTDPELLQFFVLILGFLLGLRLLPEGWGHLHGTAIEPGKCNGFLIHDKEIIPCLELAGLFFRNNSQARNVKRLQSAVSLIQWSKGQEQYFDSFNYLYMAIDACWAVCADVHATGVAPFARSGRFPHALRPMIMQQVLGLQLPKIFDPASDVTAASIRNDLIHEGLVGDMPLGLSVMPHCENEMREFADKVILALLGIKAGYLATPGGDRSRHMLDLKL
jgi:hypothetical protein